jgi:hypothetical protein
MHAKIIFPFILAVLLATVVTGQPVKPSINLTEKEFNFGTVKETDGVITHDFRFTNTGKAPLIINEVKSSCGCTVPEWTREPVLPGKSGTISVSFNPGKQSGTISKSIQINSNADVPQVTIQVKGVVIPAQKVEEVYKYTMGDLRLQTIYVSFGEIIKGKVANNTIKVLNTSASNAATITFRKVPAHLRIKTVPELIPPGQEGTIEIEYLTSEVNNWDYAVDRLDLLINGLAVANNRVNVTAIIKEDFSGLTAEELAMAGRAEFESHEYNFGTISDKDIVTHAFKVTNVGKTDLFIRKVTASCGCTAVQPAKTIIAPGDSTVIKAIFNASGREGNQKKAITVITNDPKQSRTVLWINAVVQKQAGNDIKQ